MVDIIPDSAPAKQLISGSVKAPSDGKTDRNTWAHAWTASKRTLKAAMLCQCWLKPN